MREESVFSKLFRYMDPITRERLSQAFFENILRFLEAPENKKERERFFSELFNSTTFDYSLRNEFVELLMGQMTKAFFEVIRRDPELKKEFKQLLHKAIDRL